MECISVEFRTNSQNSKQIIFVLAFKQAKKHDSIENIVDNKMKK